MKINHAQSQKSLDDMQNKISRLDKDLESRTRGSAAAMDMMEKKTHEIHQIERKLHGMNQNANFQDV